MSEKRQIHTEGVRVTAIELAKKYNVDTEKAEVAALCHDLYRGIPVDVLNYYVKHLGLDDKYLDNPNLAHGKIAAIVIERDFDIKDQDIINAVSYHTTGRANMSPLEKVIFIADAIEPNRDYPGVEELREIVKTDLDKACLTSLRNTVNFVRSKKLFLDEDSIKAKDSFEQKENLEDE